MQRRKSEWIRISTSKTFDRGFSLQCAPQKQPISSRIRVNVDKYRMSIVTSIDYRHSQQIFTFHRGSIFTIFVNFPRSFLQKCIDLSRFTPSSLFHRSRSRENRWRNPRLESWHQLINNHDAE